MTETGAQLIVNLPSDAIKPGSMGRPFPGIEAAILGDDGESSGRWICRSIGAKSKLARSYAGSVEGPG